MKLFVWNNPYHVPYGGTCLYVVAETEEQARELAKDAPVSGYGNDRRELIAEGTVLGPPTRVLETPCAECYEWSE